MSLTERVRASVGECLFATSLGDGLRSSTRSQLAGLGRERFSGAQAIRKHASVHSGRAPSPAARYVRLFLPHSVIPGKDAGQGLEAR